MMEGGAHLDKVEPKMNDLHAEKQDSEHSKWAHQQKLEEKKEKYEAEGHVSKRDHRQKAHQLRHAQHDRRESEHEERHAEKLAGKGRGLREILKEEKVEPTPMMEGGAKPKRSFLGR